MWDWARENVVALFSVGLITLLVFAGTLLAVPFVVARMPSDYFVADKTDPARLRTRHRFLRILWLVAKNMIGWLLVVAGIGMLVLPGQGILTILIGLMLASFPGKKALQCRLIRIGRVHRAVNWLRKRAHQPPLQIPPKEHCETLRTEDSASGDAR